jgi:hypothetical protein
MHKQARPGGHPFLSQFHAGGCPACGGCCLASFRLHEWHPAGKKTGLRLHTLILRVGVTMYRRLGVLPDGQLRCAPAGAAEAVSRGGTAAGEPAWCATPSPPPHARLTAGDPPRTRASFAYLVLALANVVGTLNVRPRANQPQPALCRRLLLPGAPRRVVGAPFHQPEAPGAARAGATTGGGGPGRPLAFLRRAARPAAPRAVPGCGRHAALLSTTLPPQSLASCAFGRREAGICSSPPALCMPLAENPSTRWRVAPHLAPAPHGPPPCCPLLPAPCRQAAVALEAPPVEGGGAARAPRAAHHGPPAQPHCWCALEGGRV